MQLDTNLVFNSLSEVPAAVRAAEEMGFNALWSLENPNDPFLPLAIAATVTNKIKLGTAIALAFPRSPMALAYTAWDLQKGSNGRFILGLGTQVKGHNEKRYSVPWGSPGPKMREIILALRQIWQCWQTGASLNFTGQFYSFTLMPPAFNPGPIEHPHIPIYIAGVNPYMCRLAGELCDGFHVHPFHSTKYLREAVIPLIEEGAKKGGRSRQDVKLCSLAFVITGDSKKEMDDTREKVRLQLAFYASTRTYKPMLDLHGWGDVCLKLHEKTAKGEWSSMAQEITDEMLKEYAIEGAPDEIAGLLKAKYKGLLDRVSFYHSYRPGHHESRWRKIVMAFKA
jgi:probable F420-dependent oxidoreductase